MGESCSLTTLLTGYPRRELREKGGGGQLVVIEKYNPESQQSRKSTPQAKGFMYLCHIESSGSDSVRTRPCKLTRKFPQFSYLTSSPFDWSPICQDRLVRIMFYAPGSPAGE